MLKQLFLKIVYSSFRKKLAFCLIASSVSLSALASADASQIGRYQIIHSPHVRADMMLLDTVTGKTWLHVKHNYLKGEPVFWVEEYRADLLGGGIRNYADILKSYEKKNAKAPDEWIRVKKDDNKK